MTLNEFPVLDPDQQKMIVWKGAFIAQRQQDHCIVLLYQVDAFYVEVFCGRQENRIERLGAFTDTENLEPYLADMDISGLFG